MPPILPLQLTAGLSPVPGYTLVRVLGRGGFGEVWLASAPGGFEVALKFVRLGDRAAAIEQHALDGIRKVRHGNLLPMFGAWLVGDCLVIAMELANGSLLDRLEECQRQGQDGIPRGELLGYMAEAAKGIDYLNEPRHAGPDGKLIRIAHRDIKPQNLLLVGTTCKAADFGLAKFMEHTVTSTLGSSMTPAYAPPEFFARKVSVASDQYSLAVAYCELRGGRLPFGGNPIQLMYAHLNLPPELDMLPEGEREVVARALSKKPEERWPSCQQFVRALTAPRQSQPKRAGSASKQSALVDWSTMTAPPATGKKTRRKQFPWLAAGFLLVLLAGGVAWLTSGGKPTGMDSGPTKKKVPEAAAVVDSAGKPPGKPPVVPVKPNPVEPPKATLPKAPKKVADPPTVSDTTNSIGMKFVLVQPGLFLMGSPESDKDAQEDEFVDKARGRYQHWVTITKAFHVGKHEVTVGQFRQFVEATGHETDQEKRTKFIVGRTDIPDGYVFDLARGMWVRHGLYTWKDPGYPREGRVEDHPVVLVSQVDAKAFCAWLSGKEGREYRLLTEAEWEYCARAGETTRYPGGDDQESLARTDNVVDSSAKQRYPGWTSIQGNDGYVFTAPVGQFPANHFGLHDMAGNVCEWCEDRYDARYYGSQEKWEDPEGPSTGMFCVIRGGSFVGGPRFARLAARDRLAPLDRGGNVGFRVVRVR